MKKAENSSRDAFRIDMAVRMAEMTAAYLGQPIPDRLQTLLTHLQKGRLSTDQFKMLVEDWSDEQAA
jgi:hypothetical protein